MKKKNLLSKFWIVAFVCYVGWATNVGSVVFQDTSDVYNTWVNERVY